MSSPQVLIDLTGDDTDASDDSATRNASKRPRFAPTSAARVPRPPHGMPNLAGLNTESRTHTGVLGANYLLNEAHNKSSKSGMALRTGLSPRQPIELELKGASPNHGSRSKLSFHDMEDAEAKRHSRTVIQPNSGIKRQKLMHPGELPGTSYQSSAIPQQEPPKQHRQPRMDSGSQASRQTSITGANRAAAAGAATSRISSRGAIQKPSVVQATSWKSRINEVLSRQLIPHIMTAVRPYRKSLSKDERMDMGSEIASAIVSEESFMQDLGDNEYLSARYEKYIADEIKARAASHFKNLEAVRSAKISADLKRLQHKTKRLRGIPSNNPARYDVNRVDSEASTDAEEVFDQSPPSLQSSASASNPLSRAHSFSPATSFSNDMQDSTSLAGQDEETDEQTDGMKSLPKRSSRAIEPVYAKPKRTRAKRKPNWGLGTLKSVPSSNKPVQSAEQPEVIVLDEIPQKQSTKQNATVPAKVEAKFPASQLVWTRSPPRILRDPIGELLRQRELNGMTPIRARCGQSSFKTVTSSYFEDCFVRQSEWTDCSGTILSLTWTSPEAFICGAVAHSDCNHMQYNKPGNLLLGSVTHDTLQAFPDHRMIRPVVSANENASNALEAMRQTQDPWMYAPVVTTTHSDYSGLTFTASFDKTVKVWSLMQDGSAMVLRGTWPHDDRVNFVAASRHHGRVATASESMSDAIRIYNIDENAVSESSYDQYCGNKASVQAEELRRREKWAYYPSTIQWGLAELVKYLFLVGWSPRSDSGEDTDIPEDKRNTGELCLWNSLNSSRVPINSAHLQNVFEVIWHPTQPFFLAATSPSGSYDIDTTKTQIRLFGLNATGGFINNRTFDCPAWDVNELTIMPTSGEECFVTVSCTDRCTYVYDSKRGDQPIHVLQHGESLDEPENEDSGVKFASWGNSSDRFYTGSSDGLLKAWDIKAPPGGAFVRDLLTLSGGIYAGSFSKDFSKLLIGDDTGKVHLLAVDDSDIETHLDKVSHVAHQLATTSNGLLPANIRRPKLIIPHAEPPHPNGFVTLQEVEQSSAEISKQYLDEGHLRLLPDNEFPAAGKAVFQGPNYVETLLYRFEAHEDNDATKPLLPEILQKQRFLQDRDEQDQKEARRIKEKAKRLETAIRPSPSIFQGQRTHRLNLDLDLTFEKLSLSTQVSLQEDRVEIEGDFDFDYEIMPSKKHSFLGN